MDFMWMFNLFARLRFVWNLLPFMRAANPPELQTKYNSKILARIEKKYALLKNDGGPGRNEGALWRAKMAELARWYKYCADLNWGRESPRYRLRSAWYYATSGRLFEFSQDLKSASDTYHYAAHGFRELDMLSHALAYYKKSAELSVDNPEWQGRCYARALAIAQSTCDTVQIADLTSVRP